MARTWGKARLSVLIKRAPRPFRWPSRAWFAAYRHIVKFSVPANRAPFEYVARFSTEERCALCNPAIGSEFYMRPFAGRAFGFGSGVRALRLVCVGTASVCVPKSPGLRDVPPFLHATCVAVIALSSPHRQRPGSASDRRQWLHEVKCDGYRVRTHVIIFSKRGSDFTRRFESIEHCLHSPANPSSWTVRSLRTITKVIPTFARTKRAKSKPKTCACAARLGDRAEDLRR
jgi:hypothetical protein